MLPNNDGYINSFAYKDKKFDWLFIPSEVGGNSSLPVGDCLYADQNLNGLRLSLLGHFWNGGANCGPFCWLFETPVNGGHRAFSGRLIYIPTASTN